MLASFVPGNQELPTFYADVWWTFMSSQYGTPNNRLSPLTQIAIVHSAELGGAPSDRGREDATTPSQWDLWNCH